MQECRNAKAVTELASVQSATEKVARKACSPNLSVQNAGVQAIAPCVKVEAEPSSERVSMGGVPLLLGNNLLYATCPADLPS